jgi:hypothetical protein
MHICMHAHTHTHTHIYIYIYIYGISDLLSTRPGFSPGPVRVRLTVHKVTLGQFSVRVFVFPVTIIPPLLHTLLLLLPPP